MRRQRRARRASRQARHRHHPGPRSHKPVLAQLNATVPGSGAAHGERVAAGAHHGLLLVQDAARLHDGVDHGLGTNGAPGRVHVHGNCAVHAADHVIGIAEHAARTRADAARHHALGLEHLVVDLAHDGQILRVDRPRHQKDIRMLGVAGVDHAKALRIEQRRERGQHLDIASVAARAVVMNDPRRARHFMIHGCRLLNKHVDEDGHKVEQAKH